MSSVLTLLDEVGEAKLMNSVCFLIDSFNTFVYAEAAEEETKSCVNFIIKIAFLKLLWSYVSRPSSSWYKFQSVSMI